MTFLRRDVQGSPAFFTADLVLVRALLHEGLHLSHVAFLGRDKQGVLLAFAACHSDSYFCFCARVLLLWKHGSTAARQQQHA